MENYTQSGRRLHRDADFLFDQQRHGTACHLYGLAAECSIKAFIQTQPGDRQAPHKHLPDLIDDARRLLGGRTRAHLLNVISAPGFMAGWSIGNRYWSDACFTAAQCAKYRADSRKVLACINPL